MPLVIMEAMALGVPAIGFNVRGVNDIIDHGVDGYLASFKDIKAIANFTNSLILDVDSYKKFRTNARSKVVQKYTIDNMLINYENHFIKSIQN
jgi:glycosyltransferase involved in cell wall biosynthesis